MKLATHKMKILISLCLFFFLTNAFAQDTKYSEKLVNTFKLNNNSYLLYVRKLEGGMNNSGFNPNETGEVYVLYSKLGNTRKEEFKFPKQVRDENKKITSEGSFLITKDSISITQKYFSYHLRPMGSTENYSQNKHRQLVVTSSKPIEINIEALSNEYVKQEVLQGPPQ